MVWSVSFLKFYFFYRKWLCSRNIGTTKAKTAFFDPKMHPRSAQGRSKTSPRARNNDVFFVLHFESCWGRFGVVLGCVLSAWRSSKTASSGRNWSWRRFDTCDRFEIACHGALAVQRVHFGSRLPERSRFSRYGLIQSYAMWVLPMVKTSNNDSLFN